MGLSRYLSGDCVKDCGNVNGFSVSRSSSLRGYSMLCEWDEVCRPVCFMFFNFDFQKNVVFFRCVLCINHALELDTILDTG